MATINLNDQQAADLLGILRNLPLRLELLDVLEAQLAPVEEPVIEDPAPKKSKAKAEPAEE